MLLKTGKILLIPAILLAACTLAAAAAAPGPLILKEKDRGRTINLQLGQRLILYLRNPASGGYHTNPPVFSTTILKLTDQKKLPPNPQKPLAGDFGQLYYEWQSQAKGQTDIIIDIKRPWEKKPPEEFWRVKVRVK